MTEQTIIIKPVALDFARIIRTTEGQQILLRIHPNGHGDAAIGISGCLLVNGDRVMISVMAAGLDPDEVIRESKDGVDADEFYKALENAVRDSYADKSADPDDHVHGPECTHG